MAQIDTLRPTALIAGAGWTAVPSGTLPGVTSDNSDSTYALWNPSPGSGGPLVLSVGVHNVPTGHQRHLTRVRARGQSGNAYWSVRLPNLAQTALSGTTFAGSPATINGSWGAGLNPTAAQQYAVNVVGQTNTLRIIELYVDIDSREPPEFIPQILDGTGTPNVTINDTSTPTVRTSALALDGLSQRQYRYWVTSGATIVWDTGVVSGAFVAREITPGLENGTYELHMQIWTTLGTDTAYASEIETLEFTISVTDVPEIETVTVTSVPDSPFFRVEACAPFDTEPFDPDTTLYADIRRTDCVSTQIIARVPLTDAVLNPTTTFNPTSAGRFGTVQTFVVPETGRYRIEAWGAQGGGAETSEGDPTGGLGARCAGTFALTEGDTLQILVGQQPLEPTDNGRAGGGGGSFVGVGVDVGTAIPLLVAGGGGGNGDWPHDILADGLAPTLPAIEIDGGAGQGPPPDGGSAGGTGGSGGAAAPLDGFWGASGGGWYTNGGAGYNGGAVAGGLAFVNGGAGGAGTNSTDSHGGFGGGGGGYAPIDESGGGGGYNGGGGGDYGDGTDRMNGGGGGSYNVGIDPDNDSGVREGPGLVEITSLVPRCGEFIDPFVQRSRPAGACNGEPAHVCEATYCARLVGTVNGNNAVSDWTCSDMVATVFGQTGEYLLRARTAGDPLFVSVCGTFRWGVDRPFTATIGLMGTRFITSTAVSGRNYTMSASVRSETELQTLLSLLARPLLLISPHDMEEQWASPVQTSVSVITVGRIRQVSATFIGTGPEPTM